ncbi:ArsR/SmtB family transcription factor [Streptosporangium saharense]|uniref:ArsR/SmtB family transcription factor n=1 Tax=Streptosporangium saharense TaxID=1706840 RepID=UPI003316C4DB
MVQREVLDRVFAALSDGTRRDILVRLGEGPATVSQLAERAGITVTGLAKHVKVLEEAGLVATEKVGRVRRCRLGPERLTDVTAWIDLYRRLWERRMDGLDLYFTLRKGTEK